MTENKASMMEVFYKSRCFRKKEVASSMPVQGPKCPSNEAVITCLSYVKS